MRKRQLVPLFKGWWVINQKPGTNDDACEHDPVYVVDCEGIKAVATHETSKQDDRIYIALPGCNGSIKQRINKNSQLTLGFSTMRSRELSCILNVSHQKI